MVLLPLTLCTLAELELTVAGLPTAEIVLLPFTDAVTLSVFDIEAPYLLLLTFSTLLSPPVEPGRETAIDPEPGLMAEMPLPDTLLTELAPDTLDGSDPEDDTRLTVLPETWDDATPLVGDAVLLPEVFIVPEVIPLPPLLPYPASFLLIYVVLSLKYP